MSTGKFGPKCAERHHAIYFSSSQKIITHPKDEYDSAPGRKYTAHFESFSPVSVNFLFLIKNIFQSRPGIVVKSVESEQNPLNSASYCLSGPQCLPCCEVLILFGAKISSIVILDSGRIVGTFDVIVAEVVGVFGFVDNLVVVVIIVVVVVGVIVFVDVVVKVVVVVEVVVFTI